MFYLGISLTVSMYGPTVRVLGSPPLDSLRPTNSIEKPYLADRMLTIVDRQDSLCALRRQRPRENRYRA